MVFPKPPMVAHKKNPSLANKIVRSKLKQMETEFSVTTRSQTLRTKQVDHITNQPQVANIDIPCLFHHRTFTRPCGENKCILCARLRDTTFVFSKTHKRRHYIRYVGPTMTCTTRRVVCLIRCKRCNKQYAGQTNRPLKQRIKEHLQRQTRNKPDHNRCRPINTWKSLH